MIVKTEGIILSKMKYGDTSRILRLYTRDFGKMSVIAKGIRDAKNKSTSAQEPMTHVACVVYRKDNRDLQLLSQCDVLASFRHLSEDIDKMRVGMSVIELVDIVSHAEEENEVFFTLLVDVLRSVNDATKNPESALYYFEMKTSGIMGFDPQLYHCVQCGTAIHEGPEGRQVFAMLRDGVLCGECTENSGRKGISFSAVRALQQMQLATSADSVLGMHLTSPAREEVQSSLRRHLQHHIEGFRGLRSEKVFSAF